jgi:hypothetical protein
MLHLVSFRDLAEAEAFKSHVERLNWTCSSIYQNKQIVDSVWNGKDYMRVRPFPAEFHLTTDYPF